MTIPLRIQNAQVGALSADKAYQSQKHLPDTVHRMFEAEVKKQMEEAQEKTQEAEKSEKSQINDKKEKHEDKQEAKGKKKRTDSVTNKENKKTKYIIEKAPNGTIKHLDVKI